MTRNKPVAPDQKERDRIISDLDTTLLVEAGAGSGKTTSLVDRLLALITTGKATIDKVAAVTFTRKAAAELRERFQVALEKKAVEPIPEAEKKRVLDALSHLGEATIGTIHSFCARMLRERPVEARLDPDFQEVDEADGDQLLESYWHKYLEDAHFSGKAEATELKRLGIPPEDLIELYKDMSRYRDVTPFEAAKPRPNLDAAREKLSALIKRLVPVMPSEEPDSGWDELQQAVKYTQWRMGTYGVGSDPDLVIVLERFDKDFEKKVTLNRWNDKNTAKEFRDIVLPKFVEDHVRPSLKAWREYVYPHCIRFAKGATQYAVERRGAESLLDFGDLLIKVRDLLRDDEGVREFFSKRYTRILVDEFQDTDPVQAEILFYLTGKSNSPGMGWQERRLRPGSLFVVGDPKQSIYRFRRADIDMYNLVKDLIVKSGGDVLSLIANFRSNNSIGSFVDKAFVGVFPAKADRFQSGFTSLATGRKGPAQHAGAYRLPVPGVETKDDIAEGSSRSVAAWVRWALDGNVQVEGEDGVLRPAKPGDFLVLTMGRKPLANVAEALEAQQVPFDLTGAKGFAEAPEVVDAMKLFSCLANPEDSVAVTAVLVSSLFGYSYEELYQFKKSGGHFRFIGAGVSSEGKEKSAVHESLAFLEALWEETRNGSPAAAISVILERVGMIPLTAASPLGATGAGRLYKLVEMVRIGEGLHMADFASAVKWLQEAMDPEMDRDIEPLSLLLGESDVVRVMNLHKAKGLEASIVILAAPWEFGNHEPKLHVDRKGGEESSGYFLISKKIGEYGSKVIAHPPDWDAKSTKEGLYTAAERSRLLYVAATRARQLLVVTDAPDIKRGTNPWDPLKQHVGNDLSMEGIDRTGKARPQKTVDGEKGKKHIELVHQAVDAGAAVFIRKEVVTKVAKAGVLLPSVGTQGKGPVWGEIIHRCLQAVGKGVALTKPLVESIMAERDWPIKEADEAIALIDRVRKSDLWKRVEGSKERHTEVPFAMAIDGKEIGQAEGNCLLDGVIDLVFRENGKWVIVDYKTDRVVGDIEPYMNYYSPQVKLYAKAWEKLSKEGVGAAYLYFIGPGELKPVGLS